MTVIKVWVLILWMRGDNSGFYMHEFSGLEACLNARRVVVERGRGGQNEGVCVPQYIDGGKP